MTVKQFLIEREDGSRVWAELDPLDVASISRFLDTVRGTNDGIPRAVGPRKALSLHRWQYWCFGAVMWLSGLLVGISLRGVLGW